MGHNSNTRSYDTAEMLVKAVAMRYKSNRRSIEHPFDTSQERAVHDHRHR
jgi:hypothetical protein